MHVVRELPEATRIAAYESSWADNFAPRVTAESHEDDDRERAPRIWRVVLAPLGESLNNLSSGVSIAGREGNTGLTCPSD
jgi:hypothetical protein